MLRRLSHYFAEAHLDALPSMAVATRLILVVVLAVSLLLLMDDWCSSQDNFWAHLIVTVSVLGALALTFRGYFFLARLSIPCIILVLTSYAIFVNAMGLHDSAMQVYPIVIILSGLLLGKRAPLPFAGLCVLIVFGLCHAEIIGFMPSQLQKFTNYSDLIRISIMLVATGLIAQVFMSALTSSVERARRNEMNLREANHQLQMHAKQLEEHENALRQSNERYRSLFHSNVVGVYVHDLTGQFLDANDVALKWLGYARDQIGSINFFELLIDAQLQTAQLAMKEDVRDGYEPVPYEFQVICKDGQLIWLETEESLLYREGAPYAIHGIARDITERKRTEEHIRDALREKEILLREIHHRVKNNMQVISSLLNLQLGSLIDPLARGSFQESQQRIRSMALIHEKLYQSKNLSSVHFDEYITILAHELYASYSPLLDDVAITVEADVILGIDVAIPCGLIINELVSNAMKHAFQHGKGALVITLADFQEGRYELEVRDNGGGMPEDFDIAHTETLGLQLVKGLVEEQLNGTIELKTYPGTTWRIFFTANPQSG